jgi:hypothetical protein
MSPGGYKGVKGKLPTRKILCLDHPPHPHLNFLENVAKKLHFFEIFWPTLMFFINIIFQKSPIINHIFQLISVQGFET